MHKRTLLKYDKDNNLVSFILINSLGEIERHYYVEDNRLFKFSNETEKKIEVLEFKKKCSLFHTVVAGEDWVVAVKKGKGLSERLEIESRITDGLPVVYPVNKSLLKKWINKSKY